MSGSLPDTPDGVHLATGKDKMREACWVFRSLLWERIFTRRSTTGQRLFSLGIVIIPLGALWYIGWRDGVRGFLLAAFILLVVLALCAVLLRRQKHGAQTRVYVLDDHTATLTMTADDDYWTIAGHNRSRKAPGAGERLQDLLLPAVCAAADRADVGVRLTAAAPKLAARYAQKLPGLLEVGPALPYGTQMYRPSITQRRTLLADLTVDEDS